MTQFDRMVRRIGKLGTFFVREVKDWFAVKRPAHAFLFLVGALDHVCQFTLTDSAPEQAEFELH